MTAKLITLPVADITDVPRGLRALADAIENGEHGDAHDLAWVIDQGDGGIAIGMLGASPQPGPLAHYLFALGMRKIEAV